MRTNHHSFGQLQENAKKLVHLTAKTKRFSSVSYDISRTARGVSRLSCMSRVHVGRVKRATRGRDA